MRFSTKAIHVGQEPDPATGAVIVPIYQTSTFHQERVGVHQGFEYSRTGNPTRKALETCVAALEGACFGLAFGSGLAAEHAILASLKPGDHIVSMSDIYGGTYRLFEQVFKPFGIRFSYVDGSSASFEKTLSSDTKLFWIESPTNPLVQIADIAAISKVAEKNNITTVVDNTFASPYLQQPLVLGAQIVVHSTTKYIGGHSDLVGGVVVTNDKDWYERLKFMQKAIGAIPGPFDCWLALRGLKTLAIRMDKHCSNALAVARFLEKHPLAEKVFYPGLPSSEGHELAKKQMKAFGGIVSFRLKGANRENIDHFFQSLKVFSLAESLGGVESLVNYSPSMTHGSLTQEERLKIGITDNLIRVSVGIEDEEDLIADLEQALGMFTKHM
jgi:cystathionine beta-lyase/cystathionine gamma-synthase